MRPTEATPAGGSEPPGPVPEPPLDLAERSLPIKEFDRPVWFRGHRARRGPINFNRTTGQFASPGSEFGTLYLGEDELCSFIEAFSQEIVGLGPIGPIINQTRLAHLCLCPVSATRPIRLVDLTNGAAMRRLSPDADNRINDGPHAVSQRWALAFWRHPSQPDGLLYRSRRAPERLAIALFDRVAPNLVAPDTENVLREPTRLAAILDHYGCTLVP